MMEQECLAALELSAATGLMPTGCATSYTSQAKVLQMVLCCPQGFGAEVALLVGRQKTSGEERQMLWEVGT